MNQKINSIYESKELIKLKIKFFLHYILEIKYGESNDASKSVNDYKGYKELKAT